MSQFLVILALFALSVLAQQTPQLEIIPYSSAATGQLKFRELPANGVNTVSLKAPQSITSDVIFTLPDADAVGCVQSDGAGNLSIAACSGTSLPVVDTTAIVKGSTDATKLLRFEVDGLTTATTRVLTPQDADYTIAGLQTAQTFTADQTLAANLLFSGLRDVGQAGAPASNIYANQIRIPAGPCFLAGMTTASSAGLIFSQNSSCSTTAEMDGSGFELLSTGTFRVNGTQVIDSTRRLLNISTVVSSLIPSASATYSLGDSTATGEWFQLYVRQIPAVETIWPKNSSSTIGYSGAGGAFSEAYIQNLTITGTCTGCPSGGTPGGSGSEIQFRSGASTFGGVTGSSVSGSDITLGGNLSATALSISGTTVIDSSRRLNLTTSANNVLTSLVPTTASVFNLGSSLSRWNVAYAVSLDATSATLSGGMSAGAFSTFTGGIGAPGGTSLFQSFEPYANNTYDQGSSSNRWRVHYGRFLNLRTSGTNLAGISAFDNAGNPTFLMGDGGGFGGEFLFYNAGLSEYFGAINGQVRYNGSNGLTSSFTCPAGQAVKSMNIQQGGVITATCGIP